jgi:hypothetical protein
MMEGVWGDGWSDKFEDDRGNVKVDVGIFHMRLRDPFWSPGDPASDLPDPMEHASLCLLCVFYLICKDLILKAIYKKEKKCSCFMANFALSFTLSALQLSLDLMSWTIICPLAFLYSFNYTQSVPNFDTHAHFPHV